MKPEEPETRSLLPLGGVTMPDYVDHHDREWGGRSIMTG